MIEQLKTIRENAERIAHNSTDDPRSCGYAILTALTQLEAMAGEQEPVAKLHDDGHWTPMKTEAGRALNDRLVCAGSPSIDVYTTPPAQQPQPEPQRCPDHIDGQHVLDELGVCYGDTCGAQQPQAEPDMRKVCEALGFDPTNHHNAAKCPYCRGQQPQAVESQNQHDPTLNAACVSGVRVEQPQAEAVPDVTEAMEAAGAHAWMTAQGVDPVRVYRAMRKAAPQQAEAVPVLTDSQIMASVGRNAGGPDTSISESRPLGQQWTQICALVRHIIRERYCGVAPRQAEAVPDCGEAGHDEGCCGTRDCLPSARKKVPKQAEAVPSDVRSNAFNEACWAFVEAMPHRLPGPIFNDLKPAMHAAICKYLAAQKGGA